MSTVTELRSQAKTLGVVGYSKMRKAELVDAIYQAHGVSHEDLVTDMTPEQVPALSIRCGRCRGRHESVQAVRACYGVRVVRSRRQSGSTGIRCGACQGRHMSVQAVSACYGRG